MSIILQILGPIITAIVGFFAFVIYKKQKNDYKRDAASILLMEIRYAEHLIDLYKNIGIRMDFYIDQLLPTNSWNRYNYLFIKRLDRDEIDLINNFYNSCSLIDKAFAQLSIALQLQQKSNAIHNTLSIIAKESVSGADFNNKKDIFIKLIDSENYVFNSISAEETVKKSLNLINKITTTTAGNKLKKIARLKD